MTRFIVITVAIYVALAAVLVGAAGDHAGLIEPVPAYRLAVFWAMPETSHSRIGALLAAGRGSEAMLYAAVIRLSQMLLVTLACGGIVIAWDGDGARRLSRREALLVGALMAFLVATAAPVAAMVRDLEATGITVSGGMNAMPGYWLATTVLSCSFLARYAALAAHDITAMLRSQWLRRLAPQRAP